ncbi:MAG: TRAP transporter TatT component family protein [Proteobacteria bacterium]|nr:TRAP transporter TatT component family protein [Pseudomonadota bacterium]
MKTTVSLIERSKAAMQQESDYELARAAVPSGIKTLEGFYVGFPENVRLRALLAEAVCQYGAGFLQDDWEAAVLDGDGEQANRVRASARRILARCINYGLLLLDPMWAEALWDDPPSLARLVAGAGRDEVAGMFWVGLGLASLAGMDPENPVLAARLTLAEGLLLRVAELDSGFSDGLADMSLGILYSARSAAVGGNPAQGKRHFARARRITGGKSLMVEVMYARYYAVTTRDRALFRDALMRVLRTPPSIWPENRLSNEMAQRKARRYLAHERRWF